MKILRQLQSAVLGTTALISLMAFAFAQSPAPSAQGPAPPASIQPTDGQTPSPEKIQRRAPRRPPNPPSTVTVVADQLSVAPQVVTIVHRLTGVKMLRFLLRQEGERGTLFTIDPESITSEAHASIIAGWALGDGKTIATRLPQAGAEIEFTQFPPTRGAPRSEAARQAAEARVTTAAPLPPAVPGAEPDITVITRDGRRLRAHYVGLDGQTGLSVLQITGRITLAPAEESKAKLTEGQSVQLFAPERTTPDGEASTRIIYVKVGKLEGKISQIAGGSSGKMVPLMVRAANLSPVMVGGVVCDELGNTLGIVEAIDGNYARIVTAESIRAATERVLARQTSVPRPMLGVRGEPVEFAARSTFLAHGWREDQLTEMVKKPFGILLTSVLPGSPAALAKLQPGDVILRVNQEDVASAEEFSKLLGDAGGGKEVRFAVRRPTPPLDLSVDVKLGSSFEPLFKWHFEMPVITPMPNGLQHFGVETIALTKKMALQLGSQGGLLVVAVQPESMAARGGLRAGDVIETIDGRAIGRGVWSVRYPVAPQKKHVFSLVRAREKKQIVLESVE